MRSANSIAENDGPLFDLGQDDSETWYACHNVWNKGREKEEFR